jgi:hypothetical protein
MMLAENATRVETNSPPEATMQINKHMNQRIDYFRQHREEIPERLRELDQEWDIERALETASSTLSLAGLALGITRSRKWLVLPLVVQGFFLQHALQGWCPPLPVLRKMGFRTVAEIEYERGELARIQEAPEEVPVMSGNL